MTNSEEPTMHVLDIDLDFFLDGIPLRYDLDLLGGRLPDDTFHPWSLRDVEGFLVRQCGLDMAPPVPGALVETHDEVFDHWKSLIESGKLRVPFSLTHVDSHSDMGMGDCSSSYIQGDILHWEVNSRSEPKRGGIDGLGEGNFLSFAVACRWVSDITYVHHPNLKRRMGGLHDIPNCLFQGNDPYSRFIQLKSLPPDCLRRERRLETYDPLALEPEVPIRFVPSHEFNASAEHSFIFLCHSPKYTPRTSDRLIPVIRQFIDERI